MNLIGKPVTLRLMENDPAIRLDGRIVNNLDQTLEIVVDPPDGPKSLLALCRNHPSLDVEFVHEHSVFAVAGEVDRYATRFPPAILVRIKGAVHQIQRRRYPRVDTQFSAHFRLDSPADPPVTGDATVVNLSVGGAAVYSSTALNRGQHIALSFSPGRAISPVGRVVRVESWQGGYLIGLEFTNLSENDLNGLKLFLDSHSGVA